MRPPQPGILLESNAHPIALIFKVLDPGRHGGSVAKVASQVPSLVKRVARIDPKGSLVGTIGFGSAFWDVISPKNRPAGLRPFREIQAAGRAAPATGGDLLFHIVSKRADLSFELAKQIRTQLGERVQVMEEIHGFRYRDNRDLTGFIDGTENPRGAERPQVALVGREDPEFAGGSFVLTQRYVHNLPRWETLETGEQEKIIGRRKRDSRELSPKSKPPTAHISRVVIEENGEELEIVRHSFPYGTVSEAGLFFIAYHKNLDTFEKMLSRMMGVSGDGLHDHLMDFSRAVSGATFFAPSLPLLKRMAEVTS